jgi:YbbR domain-containing protein
MKKNLNIIILSILFSIIIWVSITHSNEYYSNLKLPVKVINLTDGYAVGSSLPESISLKLKAKGWKLIGLHLSGDLVYSISAGKDTGKVNLRLMNALTDNTWITSEVQVMDIYPGSLNIFIDKIASKRLPVKADIKLKFKDGFGLSSPLIVVPDSITVYGAKRIIDTLNSVVTTEFVTGKLDNYTSFSLDLLKTPDLQYSPEQVQLTMDVQKIVEKEVSNVLVEIVNVPYDRNVLLILDRVSIGLRGGINVLGKMNIEKVTAGVKYSDVVMDTIGSIAPEISIPGNTELIYVKPDRLKYIIKKF